MVINWRIQPTKQDVDPLQNRDSRLKQVLRTTYRTPSRLPLAEAIPFVALAVLAVPLCAHAGMFSALTSMLVGAETQAASVHMAQSAQNVELLKAATHPDPNPSKGGGDVLVDAGALVPEHGPAGTGYTDTASHTGGAISVYVVREGDSLSQIAEMFGVTPNTILWANDIKRADLIQPGDSLIILPISGVRYVVKSGDTLAEIAEAYHGDVDDIIAYNGLASATDIVVGETVVIPGGEIVPKTPVRASATVRASGSSAAASSGGYFAHPVPGAVRTQGLHGYNGVDLGAPTGTAVRAAAAGEVIIVKTGSWNGGYGNYIVIKHANGTQTLYAHNSANYVSTGQYVSQGEEIGAVGSTGRSTGSHLHFEVRGTANPF